MLNIDIYASFIIKMKIKCKIYSVKGSNSMDNNSSKYAFQFFLSNSNLKKMRSKINFFHILCRFHFPKHKQNIFIKVFIFKRFSYLCIQVFYIIYIFTCNKNRERVHFSCFYYNLFNLQFFIFHSSVQWKLPR